MGPTHTLGHSGCFPSAEFELELYILPTKQGIYYVLVYNVLLMPLIRKYIAFTFAFQVEWLASSPSRSAARGLATM